MKAEFITNRDFYETFMEQKIKSKVERKLKKFLMSLLKYCDTDVVDFFVMVLGDECRLNVTIFQSDRESMDFRFE